jgi:hypothetical protein
MKTGLVSRALRGIASAPRLGFVFGILVCLLYPAATQAQTFGCTPAMANDIVCENSKIGTPENTWQIADDGDSSIQGFATDISVNGGQTINFKVKTNASSYRLDIYRLGYYQGNGARFIQTVNPSASLPQNQPACLTNASTHLYDCGNWAVSASWTVPSNATSGVYVADLIRADTGGTSQIIFIVRNDSSHSDVQYQTSDSSWQAYNAYGGTSLYGTTANIWDASSRAYKVSYNRPFNDIERITWVFGAEYPMIRWLESNGYDVTYSTDVDSDRNGLLIKNHKLFMSTGHDEYWSGGQRTNVEAARDAGVNLAFFSGNEVFWKTRWENSIDGSGTPYRTLVCYKETLALAKIDPTSAWTGTWRDPSFSPPADGGRPENGLTGTIFMVNGPGSDNNGGLSLKVPAADGKMRFWRNTSVANLAAGSTATLPSGTLGYEFDVDADNGFRPAGLVQMSTATVNLTSDYLLDYGGVYGAGTAIHHLTLYRAPSGALVFGAGTVQWSWGLDSDHTNTFGFQTPGPSTDMRQATVNLFADMGVQPATIQGGLLLAIKSTDATPSTSTITSPANGTTVTVGHAVTISGTALDGGGGTVGGVEVSTDGGATWHPAPGRASWTYSFTPNQVGSYTILSRAVDDSGNIETPGPGITVSTSGSFSISGTISPSSIGSGTTVTLSGAASKTATADSSGNYSFAGLGAGSYTVTPSKTGDAFSPLSTTVNVTSSNVTGINFTGSISSGTTYSISGTVTPSASGTGATITLTGAATASTLTDASGNFTFSGLSNGNYTLTPSKLNFAFSPTSTAVAVASANITGVTFSTTATAQTLFTTQSPTQINQTDGSTTNYELGTLVQSNTPGQITGIRFWKDSKETGTHTGHIWSSTGQLLATVTFAGETASGWQQQALSSSLSIVANTTYVVSVNTGATYYVATPSGLAAQIVNGNLVSVVGNDGAYASPGAFPTTSWQSANYFRDVVFAPGATYTISGNVSATASGATVTLTGAASATTTADASGNFTFAGLANGNYTVTPTKTGYTFSPTSAPATVNGANVTGVSFTATAIPTYSISGNVSATGAIATVTLTGTSSATTTADASGNFSFTGLANGSYTVTPTKTGYTFSPTSAPATVNGANVTGMSFTATAIPAYSISGNLSAAAASATVTLSGAASATTTADSSGNYTFTGLLNGSYTVAPSKSGYAFTPLNQAVTINSANATGVNFTAAVAAGAVIDATAFGDQKAAAKKVTSAAFSTTAANELLLAFVGTDVSSASGTNNTVTSVTGGGLTWVLVQRTNTQRGTSEIWRAFAATTLSNVTVVANYSLSNVSSITVMTFKGVISSGTNGSGAIGGTGTGNGATGAATASLVTTKANSLVVGVVEDWNAPASVTVGAGQTMVHQLSVSGLASFWVQRQAATTTAAGTTVTINDTAPTADMHNVSICEILAGS